MVINILDSTSQNLLTGRHLNDLVSPRLPTHSRETVLAKGVQPGREQESGTPDAPSSAFSAHPVDLVRSGQPGPRPESHRTQCCPPRQRSAGSVWIGRKRRPAFPPRRAAAALHGSSRPPTTSARR